jgi:hypothetical protein
MIACDSKVAEAAVGDEVAGTVIDQEGAVGEALADK